MVTKNFTERGGCTSHELVGGLEVVRRASKLILQKVFLESLCRSQLPHKSVNLSFAITNINNTLTDVSGN